MGTGKLVLASVSFLTLVVASNQEEGPTLHAAFRSILKREATALPKNERVLDERDKLYYLAEEVKRTTDDDRRPYDLMKYPPSLKNNMLEMLVNYFQNRYSSKEYTPYYYNGEMDDDNSNDNSIGISEQKRLKFLLRNFKKGENENDSDENESEGSGEPENDEPNEEGPWSRYREEDANRRMNSASNRLPRKRTPEIEEDGDRDDARFMYMDRIYNLPKTKRFPVTKRSSNYNLNTNSQRYEQFADHPEDVASGTDPKVIRDLSHIFGSDNKDDDSKINASHVKDVKRSEGKDEHRFIMKKMEESKMKKASGINKKDLNKTTNGTKEHANKQKKLNEDNKEVTEIRIAKKSIDWSNYFGYDKRKKKSSLEHQHESHLVGPAMMGDNWLLERYHKLNNLSKSERPENKQDQLQQNVDDNNESGNVLEPSQNSSKRKTFKENEERKLDIVNAKIKHMEDMIVHQALKYTGAHEGETDPAEIQDIKDKVMSRLAAAYNLEKMRKALNDFRMSISVQRYQIKEGRGMGMPEDDFMDEEKGMDQKKYNDREPDETKMISGGIYWNHFRSSGANTCPLAECIKSYCQATVRDERLVQLCTLHQLCKFCSNGDAHTEPYDKCDTAFILQVRRACMNNGQCERIIRAAALRGSSERACARFAECGTRSCIATNKYYALNYADFN